ncbi:MAG: S8 family serine peptidase [Longimicrobiales bacterium]
MKEPDVSRGIYRGEVLVSSTTYESAKQGLKERGATILHEYQLSPTIVASIEPTSAPILRDLPTIDYLEPDLPGEWLSEDTTWNIQRIDADYAWTRSTGSGVDLLIIDSGIDNGNFDLDPESVQACDGSNGLDVVGHGSFVAGIAAATNNTGGVVGTAPGVDLWSSRVGDMQGPVPSYIKCAVEYGRVNDFFVMNMSLSADTLEALVDEIEAAWNEGHVLVAAAGNTSGGVATFPAEHPDVIAVTATDENDDWAGIGPEDSEVEISAPGGVYITSTGSSYAGIDIFDCTICSDTVAATSYAAPHVAAAAAMIKSYYPAWDNEDVRDRLQETAVDLGDSDKFGYGLLDIAAAVGISPMSVSINGPSEIQPDDESCTWVADVSGGAGPYTYAWRYDGQYVGSASSWTGGLNSGDIDDEFYLSLWVYDVGGEPAGDEILVTTSEFAMWCPS